QAGGKEWAKVEKALRDAEEAAPGTPDVVLLRAEALAALGRTDAALDLLAEARAADPARVEYRTLVAALRLHRGEREAAARLLDEAERDTGDGMTLRLARARHLTGLPRDQAAPGLQKLAVGLEQFTPEDRSRLLSGLAQTWVRVGDVGEAERLWKLLAR